MMRKLSMVSIIVIASYSAQAQAGGLFGDALSAVGNVVAPGSNIGKPLDDLHDGIKKAAPVYGTIEEGVSAGVRNTTREALVETAGPALAQMIQISKNDTLRGGVQDVPPQVRQVMSRFYGQDVAAGIRYRVGNGGDLALASNAFRYGDAAAITLDDLVVFRDQQAAQDLSIWAHELKHVQQFRAWGVMDFAKRYVRDHQSVENEAYQTQSNYSQWASSNLPNSVASGGFTPIPPVAQLSNICATPYGSCAIFANVPPGSSCWCGSMNGPINGQIVGQ